MFDRWTYLDVVEVPVVFEVDVDTKVVNVEDLLVVLEPVLEVLGLTVDVEPEVAVGEGRVPDGDP